MGQDARNDLADRFREAIRPVWRRLMWDRTMPLAKFSVLNRLRLVDRATSASLARSEGVTPQAMTNTIRHLESDGYVERAADSEDRRRIWISLTATGREVIERERNAGQDWLADAVAHGLSAEERKALATAIPVLEKLGSSAPTYAPRDESAGDVGEKGHDERGEDR